MLMQAASSRLVPANFPGTLFPSLVQLNTRVPVTGIPSMSALLSQVRDIPEPPEAPVVLHELGPSSPAFVLPVRSAAHVSGLPTQAARSAPPAAGQETALPIQRSRNF